MWIVQIISFFILIISVTRCDEQIVETQESDVTEKKVFLLPTVKGGAYFNDAFVTVADFEKRWVVSEAMKDNVDDNIAKYDGKWKVAEYNDNLLQGDLGLSMQSRAKHYAISSMMDESFRFDGKPLVIQYDVRFQNGQDCGGAYLKLLTEDQRLNLKKFHDKTPYTIMFGPDKCGTDRKLHFIFRHKNLKTGEITEKHVKKIAATSIEKYMTDKLSHLYTLVLNPDNTFEISIDQNLIKSGNLLEDIEPPVNPPKDISDPNDNKPENWEDKERISDPTATKPEDWDEDEPETIADPSALKPDGWLESEDSLIPDPDAEMPSDWDETIDGEWESPKMSNPKCESAVGCGPWFPPQIKNPKYKGKWRAPLIKNPNYQGPWKRRLVPNPDYFEDAEPYRMMPISALGLELWSISDGVIFDNFIITDDKSVADAWADDTWKIKKVQEGYAKSLAERSFVDVLVGAASDRPWLWVVYILAIVLPVLLIIYCCLAPSSQPRARQSAQSAQSSVSHKKTDEPVPDDTVASDSSGMAAQSHMAHVDSVPLLNGVPPTAEGTSSGIEKEEGGTAGAKINADSDLRHRSNVAAAQKGSTAEDTSGIVDDKDGTTKDKEDSPNCKVDENIGKDSKSL